MSNCLSCQKPLAAGSHHPSCLRALFGKDKAPLIPFGVADMGKQAIRSGARMSLSGVQMKLSVRVIPQTGEVEAVPEESDTALTLNGKRDKLRWTDFENLAATLRIDPKAVSRSFQKMENAKNTLLSLCASSTLSPTLQGNLVYVIGERYARLAP